MSFRTVLTRLARRPPSLVPTSSRFIGTSNPLGNVLPGTQPKPKPRRTRKASATPTLTPTAEAVSLEGGALDPLAQPEVAEQAETPNAPDALIQPSGAYAKLPLLPPINKWSAAFPPMLPTRERVSLRNPDTSEKIAKSFLYGKLTRTDQPKIVIEAFPGPGSLSRGLLVLPPSKLAKLIILEDHEPYLKYLRPLEEADSRVKVIPMSGFLWTTYSALDEMGIFNDIDTVPWDSGVHPNLHFISHLPQSIHGEQFVAQLLRCIPERSWLFKYGRVPMSLVLGDWVWRRMSSGINGVERCKLSVITEAVSDFSLSVPPSTLLPYEDHLHPIKNYATIDPKRKPDPRRYGHPLVASNLVPLQDQCIDKGKLDQWDYILRRLFVLKSTPLKTAISSLAPGAQVLLKALTSPDLPESQRVDPKKAVKNLSVSDWTLFARAFDEWPFAPENLNIDFTNHDDRRTL